MKSSLTKAAAILLLLTLALCAPRLYKAQGSASQGPALTSVELVSDEASLLTGEQQTELTKRLLEHNRKGPGRIYVCLVKELPADTTPGQYAAWRLQQMPSGPSEKRDRVLLLLAQQQATAWLQAEPEVTRFVSEKELSDISQQVISLGLLREFNDLKARGDWAPRDAVAAAEFSKQIYHYALTVGVFNLTAKLEGKGSHPARGRESSLLPRLGEVGLLFFAYLLLIALHEFGHAFVGKLVGLRVRWVSIGWGKRLFELRVAGVRVEVKLLPLGGATAWGAFPQSGLRWRIWLATCAGPAMHLALLPLLYWLTRGGVLAQLGTPALARFCESLFFFNNLLLVGNLLPLGTGEITAPAYTDGYQLLKLPFLKQAELAEYEVVAFTHQAEDQQLAGQPAAALATYEEALAHHPQHFALLLGHAVARLKLGEHERAYQELSELLKTLDAGGFELKRFLLLNNLAYSAALLGKEELYSEADEYSYNVLQAAPSLAPFIGTRGAVLLRLGRVDEGIKLLKVAHELHTEPAERATTAGWLALGEALRGDLSEARRWLVAASIGKPCPFVLKLATEATETTRSERPAPAPGMADGLVQALGNC